MAKTCTDTDGEIVMDAQCVPCYLEGQAGPCATWTHYLEKEE